MPPNARIMCVSQNIFMYMCPIHAVVMVPVTPHPTSYPYPYTHPAAYCKGP